MGTPHCLLFCLASVTAVTNELADNCGVYCSAPPPLGTCCERFYLNVDRDSDIEITASSQWGVGGISHGPERAGLYETTTEYAYVEGEGGIAGWTSLTNDQNQWIQVDFGSRHYVTGVLLQGRGLGCCSQWVRSFRVLYSNDGERFHSTPTLEGAFDRHTVATRYFDRPIRARYFRINPITWQEHITLRFDLIGCRGD